MRGAIALLFLLATASLHAQSRPDWENYGFSKPVRMIRAEVERTVDGVRGPRLPQETVTFDEKGNITGSEVYKPNGSLQRKLGWGHEYDADGREIKTTFFNDKGRLTNTGVHIYDPQGRRIQTTQINPNGSINHIQSFSYDDKGNITRESHRNENGSPRFLVNRKYDGQGHPIEEVFIDAKGSFTHRNVTTYDERGNQTGWTLFKKDGTVVQVFRNSFSYDDRGNIKEYSSHGSDGALRTKASFTYEFDDRGNWTKRTAVIERFKDTHSQIETEVTFRRLTYF